MYTLANQRVSEIVRTEGSRLAGVLITTALSLTRILTENPAILFVNIALHVAHIDAPAGLKLIGIGPSTEQQRLQTPNLGMYRCKTYRIVYPVYIEQSHATSE